MMNLVVICRRSLSVPAANRFVPHLTYTKQLLRPSHAGGAASRSCVTRSDIPVDHEKRRRSTFDSNRLQSLSNPYTGEIYVKRADELKEIVKQMLLQEDNKTDPVDRLVLIDDLQRLGLDYHFQIQIKHVLKNIFNKSDTILQLRHDDLYAKALLFRLFRQHGFKISQEIFDCFKDPKGFYKTSICKDTKGMLYLYEASYLSIKGESTLDLAREFTEKHLRKSVDGDEEIDHHLAALVHHALKLPLHWRTFRSEARWFIDIYKARADMNPLVLKLAKLDFNILQSIHNEDLKDAARLWENMGVAKELTYVRNAILPSWFVMVQVIGEPQYAYARRMMTLTIALGTILDDIYDTYGTLDELEFFTDAIERWDMQGMDQLPHYMNICFPAIDNIVNEIAYDSLKKHGIDLISDLKKTWADYCKASLVDAKWNSGYEPTLEEYIKIASVTSGVHWVSMHTISLVDNWMNRETLETIRNNHDILRSAALLTRLLNDSATRLGELKKGNLVNYVQCYMIETGASEEATIEHVRVLISETWKTMNKGLFANSPFPEALIKVVVNINRALHSLYESGDGFDHKNNKAQDQIAKLYFEPIPIEDL